MIKSLIEFLKEMFLPELLIKEVTLDFLNKERMELVTTEKYIHWLKKRLTIFEVMRKEREEKGLIKDPLLEEAIKLLKDELNKFEIKMK